MTHPGHVSLMAAAEFRDALEAHQRGDTIAAATALLSIDAASWQAIERRLSLLGASVNELLAALDEQRA